MSQNKTSTKTSTTTGSKGPVKVGSAHIKSSPVKTVLPKYRFDVGARDRDFSVWADSFYQNGFLILENALDETMIKRVKNDMRIAHQQAIKIKSNQKRLERPSSHLVYKPFFEKSSATVDIIENSVLSDFAEYVIADVPSNFGGGSKGNPSTYAHVFHNNAYSVPAKQGWGQANVWHTDDPLQNVILPPGVVLPKNVRLPVLAMTYMIWISDVSTEDNGPTHVIPGSHRFGKPCPGKEDREKLETTCKVVKATGPAGTAVLINNQLWHRGAQNTSNINRDTLQLSYGRRIIGHKYKTIMNYNMPDYVWKGRSEKLKRRLGFLQGGAYS